MGIRVKSLILKTILIFSQVNLALDLPFRLGKIILNGGRYFQSPPEKYLGIAPTQPEKCSC